MHLWAHAAQKLEIIHPSLCLLLQPSKPAPVPDIRSSRKFRPFMWAWRPYTLHPREHTHHKSKHELLGLISVAGVPDGLRSNGGSQRNKKCAPDYSREALLKGVGIIAAQHRATIEDWRDPSGSNIREFLQGLCSPQRCDSLILPVKCGTFETPCLWTTGTLTTSCLREMQDT